MRVPRCSNLKLLCRFGLLAAILAASVMAIGCAWAQSTPSVSAPGVKKPAAPPTAAAHAAPKSPGPVLGTNEGSGPSSTTSTYDDWVVRCERSVAAGGVKVCEAAQTLQIGNQQQQLVAQVVFGRLNKEAPLRLVVQLPVGVWLPAGAQCAYGEKPRAASSPYTFCIRACALPSSSAWTPSPSGSASYPAFAAARLWA